jgi:hypothetical protein
MAPCSYVRVDSLLVVEARARYAWFACNVCLAAREHSVHYEAGAVFFKYAAVVTCELPDERKCF